MTLRRRLAPWLLMFAVSGFLVLVVGELVLRVVPISGVTSQPLLYDELTGSLFYPGTKLIYRNTRGDDVHRRVNTWGFLDVDHETNKPTGTLRVGFFGDSYTEARQVPLEETFFRLVEEDLNTGMTRNDELSFDRVETLAYGVSARGPIDSYLECGRRMRAHDLDYVVYVFVENDPGDQIREIKQSPVSPYVTIAADSFAIDDEFRRRYAYKKSRLFRTWQFLKARSLLLGTMTSRLRLLRRHGVRVGLDEAEKDIAGGGKRVGTVPSTWPDSLYAVGETLLERVLDRWHRDVIAAGRTFVLCYVPGQYEMAKPREDQDSWALWLATWCASREVPFIDPSPHLVQATQAGQEIFFDHFTSKGHRVFADAIVEFFDDTLGSRSSSQGGTP